MSAKAKPAKRRRAAPERRPVRMLSELGMRALRDWVFVWPDDPEDVKERTEMSGLLLVKRDSGLEIPADSLGAIKDVTTGTVVGVGPGVIVPGLAMQAVGQADGAPRMELATTPIQMPMAVEEGDRVLHSKYGLQDVEVSGFAEGKVSLVRMREDDVLLKLPRAE